MPTTITPSQFVSILTALKIADRLRASASNLTLRPAQREDLEKAARRLKTRRAR